MTSPFFPGPSAVAGAGGLLLALTLLLSPEAHGQQNRAKAVAPKRPSATATTAATPRPTAVPLPVGVRLVENWRPAAGELGIAYSKYQLPNGLTIVVHEATADPVVHVSVAYHTGSARETAGRSGFAHFFEHMMFEGSDNVAAGEHFKIIEGAGGDANGFTQNDITVYHELLPANYLETALWLEADRMGFLHNAVTPERFENQRATVKNERGQNYDSRPYGRASEVVEKALYPAGHPYSWPTIGYEADLNAATAADLRAFLLRWYGPNNATLTIAGDVEPTRAVGLAMKYFGSIPQSAPVAPLPAVAPVRLTEDRYVSYSDAAAELPMLVLTFPTVPRGHADEPALDALAMLLGSGKNSLLYERLVKTQLAVDVNAWQSNAELGGELTIQARPAPGHTLAEVEAAVRATLAALGTRPTTADDLTRMRAQRERSLAESLTNVNQRGLLLSTWQTIAGTPSALTASEKRYQRVTAADLTRTFGEYLAPGHGAVVLSVLPKQQPTVQPARADSFTPPAPLAAAPDAATGLSYQKPTDTFDRKARPVAGVAPAAHVPSYWTTTLANGLRILGTTDRSAPVVSMALTQEGGQQLVPATKAGLAALTADMLNESTRKYSAEAFDNQLDLLGATVQVAAQRETFAVEATTLSRNLAPTMALLTERLLHPRFDTAEFRRVRQRALAQVADRHSQPSQVANQVFRRALYGPEHPFGQPLEGLTATLTALKLTDAQAFYRQQITPSGAILTVVGDVTQEQFLAALGELKTWKGAALTVPKLPAAPPPRTQPTVYVADRAATPQIEIRLGDAATAFDATGPYFRSTLVNVPVVGAFSSRLNHSLREDKGWTYGIHGGFSESRAHGTLRLMASIKAASAIPAIHEVLAQLDSLRKNGLTDEEVTFMRRFVGQTEALRYTSTSAKLHLLTQVARYHLPTNFPAQQQAIVQSISRGELNQLAAEIFDPTRLVVVVVGPAMGLNKPLARFGYKPIVTDADGTPVTIAAGLANDEPSVTGGGQEQAVPAASASPGDQGNSLTPPKRRVRPAPTKP
jgi:zinc protease